MDNYQEWINSPTVVGDANITDPIIEQIDPRTHQDNEHTSSLKSTILIPNSGWQFLHSMLYKIICFMLLCTFKAKVPTCKTILYIIGTLFEVVILTPIAIYKWFNKSQIRHTKKHRKISNGSGEFSHNFCVSKKSCYNEQNCKSGRHGCRHTFMKRKSRAKRATTNNSNQNLKIKCRKLGTVDSPLLKDLIVCYKPSIVGLITKILTILNITLNCTTNLTCTKIIYPWNKIKLVGFPSAFPNIVFSDMFFWMPTHSMMWTHGKKLYDHPRNQGVYIYGCSIFGARLFKQESCFISSLLLFFSLTFYFFIFALLV